MKRPLESLDSIKKTVLKFYFLTRILVHGGHTAVGCIIVQLCAMYNINITTSCISQAVNKMIDAGAQNILLLDHANPDELSTKRSADMLLLKSASNLSSLYQFSEF